MKVILFGASGNLGTAIAHEVVKQGHELTVVVRNKAKADKLAAITANHVIIDVTDKNALAAICKGYDAIISSLGKSVSLNDKSYPGFYDIDFMANSNILEEAKKSGIKKFVYVSAYKAEECLNLNYFKVHHDFAESLKKSRINYSIIKPPAIFCAFIDLIDMAKKGKLVTLGEGDKKTNPIYEGDLAKICVNALNEKNTTVEAGGKHIYTRKQLNEIIQQAVAPDKKIKSMPLALVKFILPFIEFFNKNTGDKFAFFTEVIQHDLIAPQVGEMRFEEYIRMKI